MATDQQGSEGLDLSQFHAVFFEEAAEHLQRMEGLLLAVDVSAPEAEQLNAIFRTAHSIKGGAATFGFQEITELTHEMETVFDKVRKNEIPLNVDLVDVFLASGDMLKALLARRRGDGAEVPAQSIKELCTRLRAFLEAAGEPAALSQASAPPAAKPAAKLAPPKQLLELVFGPFDKLITSKTLDGVVADLAGFGEVTEIPLAPPPKTRKGTRAKTVRERRFRIVTTVSVPDMVDTLGFMLDPDKVKVTLLEVLEAPGGTAQVEQAAAAQETASPGDGDTGFGLFVDAATLPANQQPAKEAPQQGAARVLEFTEHPKAAAASLGADATSIRVSVPKVDQLINLVGELVITQAMLAQTASRADPVLFESLFNGLAQLERNTRDLQEAAMSIRMMPMSFVFSRFPRVVRDMAQKLGKEIELHTVGEGTELDKGLIERIVDPLTHLVRNSVDHGVELPQERVAKGKVAKGTITLRAYHHGGNIVIEVSDDGAGLDRGRLLDKAGDGGMGVSGEMTDQDVWQLIFEPGLSTAAVVTDVSGRGVGMDVVKRNIKEMGGRVEIESTAGIGTRICIRLPLTLAILEGMSVRVGREIFIIPLTFITESLQPKASAINSISGKGRVIDVRGNTCRWWRCTRCSAFTPASSAPSRASW